MLKKSPTSRRITIYRASSFLIDAQKGGAAEFIAQAKKSIGSFWARSETKAIGSGLTLAEQKLLMPHVIDCEVTDRQFRTKVSEYFASIKTSIPYEKGLELEIGLEKSNDDPLSEDNMPLNLFDYITYRHAIAHPQVAASKAEADGNQLKEFYVVDPQALIDQESKLSKVKDAALELYLKVKEEPKKIDMLLTLMGVDPREFSGPNAMTLKIARLKELADQKADEFVDLYEDKFFEDQYVIQTMINTGVLKKIGDRIIDPQTGNTIGHNMQEAIVWLRDDKNSESIVILKARMQEGLSKSIPTKPKARK